MRGVFVTGTGTGVGKTVLAAAIARSRGWGYWKPIQTGSESDTLAVQALAKCAVHDLGIRLPDPLSPHLAARNAGVTIDLAEVVKLAPGEGDWVVEGAGGVLVPINATHLMIDLMESLGLPVVIAAQSILGTINHTLLTLTALRARKLAIEKVVIVGDPSPDNKAAIEFYGRVRVEELPRLEPLTHEALRNHTL